MKVVRTLLDPSIFGALYLTALTLIALLVDTNDVGLGAHGDEIMGLVHGPYRGEVRKMGAAMIAVAIASGILLGGAASLLLAVRASVRPGARGAKWSLGVVLVVGLHAVVMAFSLISAPQLYASVFYARGGVARLAQVLLTDTLGRWGLGILVLVLLLRFVLGGRDAERPGLVRLSRYIRRGPRVLSSSVLLRVVLLSLVRVTAALLALAAVSFFPRREAIPRKAPPAETTTFVAEAKAQDSHGRDDELPNIVLLGADSFRADHLRADVTPRLAALAEHGTVFEHAYVSLPRTFPSWVTMLTGMLPHEHRIRDMFPRWEEREKPFDAVPSRLRDAGYRTVVVSDYAGDIFQRASLGFDDVRTPTFNFRELVRQRALERATPLLPFLTTSLGRSVFPVLREFNQAADPFLLADDVRAAIRTGADRPLFLTVFFSTAHFPYAAPYPYYRAFTDRSYRGRFKYHRPVGLDGRATVDEEDVAQIRGLYKGALASIDAAAGPLVEELLASKRRTIVVLMADHGETLYEGAHGQGHGNHLFGDEALHIPLVFLDSRDKVGRRIPGIVRDIDLAPTLLDLALHAPQALGKSGETLTPAFAGKAIEGRVAFAETGLWFTEEIDGLEPDERMPYPAIERLTEIDLEHGDEVVLRRGAAPFTNLAKHRMVRDDHYKLVYLPTRSGPRLMLFDTTVDPLETVDVARAKPEIVERLRARLRSVVLSDPETTEERGLFVPRATRAIEDEGHLRLGGSDDGN